MIIVMVKAREPAVPQAHTAWSSTFGKAMAIRRVPQPGTHGSTNGGCDMGGCGAHYTGGGQMHFRVNFDFDGNFHVLINGKENGGFSPYPQKPKAVSGTPWNEW